MPWLLKLFRLLLNFSLQRLVLHKQCCTTSSKSLLCFLSFSIKPELSSDTLLGETKFELDFCLVRVGSNDLIFSSASPFSLSNSWTLICRLSLIIFFSFSKCPIFLRLSWVCFSYFYFCSSHSLLMFSVNFSKWATFVLVSLRSSLWDLRLSFSTYSFSIARSNSPLSYK